jgi:hypothetical protein
MRTLLLVAMSALAGAALGAGATWARYYRVSSPRVAVSPDLPPDGGPQPRLAIATAEHAFGLVPAETTVEHAFQVRNDGQFPLVLEPGGTSCSSCTIGRIEQRRLQPGESTRIIVAYHAGAVGGEFRKTATILSNDPVRREQPLVLTVSGRVVPVVELVPPELVLSGLSAGESSTAEVRLLAYFDSALELGQLTWSQPDSAPYFAVAHRELPAAPPAPLEARAGRLLNITIRPGLPVGVTEQKLLIPTGLTQPPQVVLPVRVVVSGEVELSGSDWDARRGVLALGSVSRAQGLQRQLLVRVRGPHRHDIEIRPGSAAPEWIGVAVGPRRMAADGSVATFPLTVEIPPGSPVANHLGADPARWAQVVLHTTHPSAREIKVLVKFAVE